LSLLNDLCLEKHKEHKEHKNRKKEWDMEIHNESAYNLWRAFNGCLSMLRARGYSNICYAGDDPTDVAEELDVVEDEELSWDDWCERFDYTYSSNEYVQPMDGLDYSTLRRRMSLICGGGEPSERIIVVWYTGSKLGTGDFSTIKTLYKEYKLLILVHNSKISSEATTNLKDEIRDLPEGTSKASIRKEKKKKKGKEEDEKDGKKMALDLFTDIEFLMNRVVTQSVFSTHEICSAKKKEKLFKRYGVNVDRDEYPGVPLIMADDYAAKLIGAKPNDLIRVRRKTRTQLLPNGEPGDAISYRLVVKNI
jgi:DNA-directed RNA polymerase subunit H (RpoH/RPB5)